MSLRLQLLALGALTLLLPWAGLRFVQQTEESLRELYEDFLRDEAGGMAGQIGDDLARRGAPAPGLAQPIYAYSLTAAAPGMDGSRSDWQYEHAAPGSNDAARAILLADGSRVWLAVQGAYLFVFVQVVDEEVVYQTVPGRAPHGDRIVLLFGRNPDAPGALLLPSIVQSALTARSDQANLRAQRTPGSPRYESTGEIEANVAANWQSTPGGYSPAGYTIEARIPLRTVDGALGVGIVDTDDGGSTVRLAAATWAESEVPNALVREWPELDQFLAPRAGGGNRFRILDTDGFVLADSGPLDPSVRAGQTGEPSLVERFFRYTLRRDDPDHSTLELRPGRIGDPSLLAAMAGEGGTAWFGIGSAASAIVAAIVPIRSGDTLQGAVLLERASDPVMTLTNEATLRLMATTVLVSLIAAALLLAYASYLSFRVGRLARAAESALGPRGEIHVALPGTRARDEIGVLARSFEDLLGRLRDYTEYLQSLKSKLSHELRTPLAIVATSLDNLEHEAGSEAGRAYLARLRNGTNRLESILQAMTAATRVEQAVRQTEIERFDLGAVISGCVAAYGDVYAGQRFEAALPAENVWVKGSAELIEQLLDKLIDNAVSFAAAGTAIEVSLTVSDSEAALAVVNRGPLLPEAMRHQLFDSLVSVRDSGGDRPHLGLGLYIVTLIAEFHGGRVEADNLPDGGGVRFGVVLPTA